MPPTVIKLLAPRFRKKIAMFDYDGTLVKPRDGRPFPKDIADWQWTHTSVPAVLQATYDKGFMILICTQQSKPWKVDQIRAVLEPLKVPMTITIALDKADYKPALTIFHAVVPGDKEWDRTKSFMVGDALGRTGDWSDCDRGFAEALKVKYKSPEDVFTGAAVVARAAAPGAPEPFAPLTTTSEPSAWMRVRASLPHVSADYGHIFQAATLATHITKDMHIKFLQWKMGQGKMRAMLMKYARELTEADIEAASREAYALCHDNKYMEAMEKYKTLKGTGYALASLVLTTQCARIPFMSDQLLAFVLPGIDPKYNKAEFKACYDFANAKAMELAAATKTEWTARDVERCVRNGAPVA